MPSRKAPASSFAVILVAGWLLLLAVPACGGSGEPMAGASAAADEPAATEPLIGPVTRAELEAHRPDWVAALVEAAPDREASRALTAVAPGGRVLVYLGTWCSDSRRELPRLWRGFDDAGVFSEDELPFAIEYVGLDEDKAEPSGRAVADGVEYVPTFIVSRDGAEVGRIVEESTDGIERHLLALLSGEASGVISARDDVGDR